MSCTVTTLHSMQRNCNWRCRYGKSSWLNSTQWVFGVWFDLTQALFTDWRINETPHICRFQRCCQQIQLLKAKLGKLNFQFDVRVGIYNKLTVNVCWHSRLAMRKYALWCIWGCDPIYGVWCRSGCANVDMLRKYIFIFARSCFVDYEYYIYVWIRMSVCNLSVNGI